MNSNILIFNLYFGFSETNSSAMAGESTPYLINFKKYNTTKLLYLGYRWRAPYIIDNWGYLPSCSGTQAPISRL
jgi:hypothetical protein